MEEHAREAGCRLILDPEAVKSHGRAAAAFRLRIMKEFPVSMADDRIQVVFAKGEIQTGLIIVGDWFVADAVVPLHGESYQKTVFTRHGPTVARAVEVFDREFADFRDESGTTSRSTAIAKVDEMLAKLE